MGLKFNQLSTMIIFILACMSNTVLSQENLNTTLIGRWADGACFAVDVINDTAYFGNGGNFEIVDFSDPLNPSLISKIMVPGLWTGVI